MTNRKVRETVRGNPFLVGAALGSGHGGVIGGLVLLLAAAIAKSEWLALFAVASIAAGIAVIIVWRDAWPK